MRAPTRIRLELVGLAPLPSDLDPDEEGLAYGRALTECRACLGPLAQRLGVQPLHRFEDDESAIWDEHEDDVMRRAEDERDAEAQLLALLDEHGAWFDAEDGLATVEALIAHVETQDPEAPIAGSSRARDVLWDLRALEAILREALERGRRFRLTAAA